MPDQKSDPARSAKRSESTMEVATVVTDGQRQQPICWCVGLKEACKDTKSKELDGRTLEDNDQEKASFRGNKLQTGQVESRSADAERTKGHQPGDVHDNQKSGTTHQDGWSHNGPYTVRGRGDRRNERRVSKKVPTGKRKHVQRKCATRKSLHEEGLPAQDNARGLKVHPGSHDHRVVTGPEGCATKMWEEDSNSAQGRTLNLRIGKIPRTDCCRIAQTLHEWVEHLQLYQTAHVNHLLYYRAVPSALMTTSDSDSDDLSWITILNPTDNF
jgi:hypothetical protein